MFLSPHQIFMVSPFGFTHQSHLQEFFYTKQTDSEEFFNTVWWSSPSRALFFLGGGGGGALTPKEAKVGCMQLSLCCMPQKGPGDHVPLNTNTPSPPPPPEPPAPPPLGLWPPQPRWGSAFQQTDPPCGHSSLYAMRASP